MAADRYDARDTIRWSTITLSLAMSGSWAYDNGTGHSGSLAGDDSLVLDRLDFDRDTHPDDTALPASPPGFVTFREIRSLHNGTDGPPLILLSETLAGTPGEFTHEVDGVSENSTATSFGLQFVPKEGQDWGDPESLVNSILGSTGFASGAGFFTTGLEVIEYVETEPEVFEIDPRPAAWIGGATITRTLTYDILAPAGSVSPAEGEIMGSGSITMTAVFA